MIRLGDETGRQYDLDDLQSADVDWHRIASRLGQLNRYGGALRHPVSVAAHSVLVSLLCPPGEEWGGLTHDVTEAYVSDLISPIKRRWWMFFFRRLERRVRTRLADLIGIPLEESPAVRHADQRAGQLERWLLRGDDVGPVNLIEAELARSLLREMSWSEARDLFLIRLRELRRPLLGGPTVPAPGLGRLARAAR